MNKLGRPQIIARVKELAPWFYSFDLGDGIFTPTKLPPDIQPIHQTRGAMVATAIRHHFGARLGRVCALDVGCHEGYFTLMLAEMGVKSVVGLDIRPENLEKAKFVQRLRGIKNVRYQQANVEQVKRATHGEYDLCLCLGLLYHAENPVLVLRRLSAITREMLIVETQVIDSIAGETEWGQRADHRRYNGVLAVIDETNEFNAGSPEAGSTAISLCPSLEAAETLLRAVGFRHIALVEPPDGAYEQHARKKRVVITATK